ncbi:DUF1604 domain-containing protein [Coprinopsis cinerea AmutBmut pab1-1]|nr:DUF1604 domain-containing protein [Coprinopsis cinerea AmutBmut pab1-1]
MGWRPGQGIGPRVSLKERKRQDEEAFDPYTGLKHTGQSLSVAEDDEEASKHTYPRRDIPVLHVSRKENRHGLGYKPGMSLNDSLGRKAEGQGPSGPRIAAGFGLGALNDADEDDLDIYDSSSTTRNRVAFDHLDHDREETMTISGRAERGPRPKPGAAKPDQFFPDGTPVVTGFTISNEPVMEDKWFPGPEVPPGWKPDPRRVWDSGPDKENLRKPLEAAKKDRAGRPELSAHDRANILGETPLPSTGTRSVFEFMSAKDKERIQRIAAGGLQAASPSPSSGGPIGPKPPLPVPTVDPQAAQAALKGFQPFTSDPAKQARYTAYLHSQATPDSAPPLKPLPGQDDETFLKELEDYSKAAQLFKPISGAMAGRFTSAAVYEAGPKIHEGLHQPSAEELAQKEEEKKKEEEANVSPKVHAARMGMYGPMTRETSVWMPAPLLCKRFGVKPPNPTVDDDVMAGTSAKMSFETKSFEQEVAAAASSSAYATGSGGATSVAGTSTNDLPRRLENIGLGEDETQGADILTYERPSMDIFKAIFASDDEDSDDEPEKEEEPEEKPAAKPTVVEDTGPVDLATFKPTFIPRDGKGKAKDDGKGKEKKEKKEKQEKKKAAMLSFAVDEEDGEPNLGQPTKERPKKKRKDKEKKVENNDEGMFIDRPAESVPVTIPTRPVQSVSATPEPPTKVDAGQQAPIPKGRKRAIDFLDD